LIPRRKNDVSNPIGGVRNLIPGKGDYKSNQAIVILSIRKKKCQEKEI